MFLIVGLGNPEKKYNNTYHNIGFMALDFLAQKLGFEFNKKQCKAITAEGFYNGEKLVLAKPQTYMNLSGQSVLAFKAKHKIPNNKILVVVDDCDLPLGSYRFKMGGSGGTHNGMRNIVFSVGSDFPRMRIGIGKPEVDIKDYVLSEISKDNKEIISCVIQEAADIILSKVQ